MSTRNVTNLTNRIDHNPDGVAVEFQYDFPVHLKSDMTIFFDGNPYAGSFNVTGLGENDGGTVIFDTPPDGSIETLTLMRTVPLTQEVVYPEYGPFPAKSHENALDKLTFITQQLAEDISRCWQAPVDGDEADLADHIDDVGTEVHGLGTASTESADDLAKTVDLNNHTGGEGTEVHGLGTASIADVIGDVELGDIMESGSNANGSWHKFADGLMICQSSIGGLDMSTHATGAIFSTNVQTWTLPQAFASPPVTRVSDSASSYFWFSTSASDENVVSFRGYLATDSGSTSRTVKAVAIGRWK